MMNLFPIDREITRIGRHFGAWVTPDGSQGQRIYARPIHRWQEAGGSGQWVEMDNQILAPWKFQVDGKALDFSLGKLQAKTEGGAVRDISLADTVTTSGSGDKMTCYPYPGVEIDYEIGLAGVKETIRVNSLPALPGGAFKPKRITISGQVAGSREQGLQRKVATFRDAEGSPGLGYLVWDGDKFELGIDVAWLYSAALPVVIDPTINAEGNDISLYFYTPNQPINNQWRKCFVKFDVTSIPDSAVITAATWNLYVTLNGDGDVTLYCRRFNSQTWLETDTVAVLDAIAMGADLSSHLENGFTLNAYYGFNVRYGSNADGIEADVSGGNQYFTPGLWYSGATAPDTQDNTTTLHCGSGGAPLSGLHAEFQSAEGANIPYLDVTYTTPSAGGHFAVMV